MVLATANLRAKSTRRGPELCTLYLYVHVKYLLEDSNGLRDQVMAARRSHDYSQGAAVVEGVKEVRGDTFGVNVAITYVWYNILVYSNYRREVVPAWSFISEEGEVATGEDFTSATLLM